VPGGVALEHAALAACPIGVALKGVEDVGGLLAGETVVVTGVSGGLGVHAAQVARAAGARVLGVTSSPEKTARLEAMPWLDAVIVDGDLPFPDQVRALTNDGGAALVVDTVGGRLMDKGVRALGPRPCCRVRRCCFARRISSAAWARGERRWSVRWS